MITNISDDLKIQLINNRLQNLSRQYFEAQMDKKQADANGLVEESQRVTDRMTQLDVAYKAIQTLLPTTTTTA